MLANCVFCRSKISKVVKIEHSKGQSFKVVAYDNIES